MQRLPPRTTRAALAAMGLLACLGVAALVRRAPAAAGPVLQVKDGTMTRDDANRLVKAYMKSQGVKSAGLNDKNLGGLDVFGQALYFEYVPDHRLLRANALVYRFHKPPRPGVIEGFQQEAAQGTDAGGGVPEYQPENHSLFLVRTYGAPVPESDLVKDMGRLTDACRRWGGEVLERVAARVFHPEPGKK